MWKFLHLVQTELAVEQYLTCHIILDKVAITKLDISFQFPTFWISNDFMCVFMSLCEYDLIRKSTDNDSVSETSIGRGTWGFGCGPNRVFEVFRDVRCPHSLIINNYIVNDDFNG